MGTFLPVWTTALRYIMCLYYHIIVIHWQVSVQVSLVALLVIPLIPGEELLLFPAFYNAGIQHRSWEQKHCSAATSSLNFFKNLISPNYTVLVTSSAFAKMHMNWHASMHRNRRALLGKAWGAYTFVYHMGMQMLREAQRRITIEVMICNQAAPFLWWRTSARRMLPWSCLHSPTMTTGVFSSHV